MLNQCAGLFACAGQGTRPLLTQRLTQRPCWLLHVAASQSLFGSLARVCLVRAWRCRRAATHPVTRYIYLLEDRRAPPSRTPRRLAHRDPCDFSEAASVTPRLRQRRFCPPPLPPLLTSLTDMPPLTTILPFWQGQDPHSHALPPEPPELSPPQMRPGARRVRAAQIDGQVRAA